MSQNKKVTITIAGPGNGIPAFAMVLLRACAQAEMKCTTDQRLLQELDETSVRKIGPEALNQFIFEMAESGVEVELLLEPAPRQAAEVIPPPGTAAGFVKDHPMAPDESPFAEVARAVQADRDKERLTQDDREDAREFAPDPRHFIPHGAPMTGFHLLLPSPLGYRDGRTEVPPGVIPVVENPSPEQLAFANAGLLNHYEALAGGYAFLARHSPADPPMVQRVNVQAGFLITGADEPEALPLNPFPKTP